MSSVEIAAWALAGISATIAIIFLLILPQLRKNVMRNQEAKRQKFLKSIKKNQAVILIGGIHGIVKDIIKNTVVIEIAPTVNITIEKDAIIAAQ